MFAPPGVDSDDSSEEEHVAPPPPRPRPKFSLKAIFNPALSLDAADDPKHQVGHSSGRKSSFDATLPSAPAVSKLKKRMRIFVDGEEHPDKNDSEPHSVSDHTTPHKHAESDDADMIEGSKTDNAMEILDMLRHIVAASMTQASSKPDVKPDDLNAQGFDQDSAAPVVSPAEASPPLSQAIQAGALAQNGQKPVHNDGSGEPLDPTAPPQTAPTTPHGLNESYYNSYSRPTFPVTARGARPPDQTSSTPEVTFPLPQPASAFGSVDFPLPHPRHNAPPPSSTSQSPYRPPPFYPHPPALQPWHPYYPAVWPPAPTWGVPPPLAMHSDRYQSLNLPHGGRHQPFSPLENPWDSARRPVGAQSLRPHLEAHGMSLQAVPQYKPVQSISDDRQSDMGRIGNYQAHQGTTIRPSVVGNSTQSAPGQISQNAATRISHEGAPRPKDTPTWSKCLVSLATCIDLINDMLSHMKAERIKDHGWPWVFGKLLQSLMMQKDLLSTVKDLVGQEDSGMIEEFGRHLRLVCQFLADSRQHGTPDQRLHGLERLTRGKSTEIQTLAVQRSAERLMHSKRFLTPSLLSSLGGLLEEFRKDGMTTKTCMHAVKVIRQELDQLEEKPHIEGASGSAPGVKEALQKILDILKTSALSQEEGSTSGVLNDRRESESGSGDHHEPFPQLLPTEEQQSASTRLDTAKGSAPRPKPDRMDSMSSDSHYSDDSVSEGTVNSDIDADRLLAQADTGPLSGQR